MKKPTILVVVVCMVVQAATVLAAIPAQSPARVTPGASASQSPAAVALKQDMRKLWTDHFVWTRDYIIAALGDQPDAQAAANRLMKNQEDIGNAVATFYGALAAANGGIWRQRSHTEKRRNGGIPFLRLPPLPTR
jgi:hypothetical protein